MAISGVAAHNRSHNPTLSIRLSQNTDEYWSRVMSCLCMMPVASPMLANISVKPRNIVAMANKPKSCFVSMRARINSFSI